MLMYAVAVAVSAIPEGLPAVISVTLALGVRRMARRNAIVRRMSAVETLGSTTVICSDKTGTITENQMTVRRLWAGGQAFEVSGEGYQPEGELKLAGGATVGERPAALERLLRIGTLSNNADLKEEDGQWRVEGNPSEGALLAVAIKAGLEVGPMREEGQRLAEIPFSSDAKYMATLHPNPDGDGRTAFVKGAPEKILEFCSHVLRDGKPVELDEDLHREIGEISERYAAEGLRVMAGAYRELPQGQAGLESADVESGLTFAGLWGMFDPPRKESAQAVSDAKGAGIHPVMITGDHAVTALAIARQVGITKDGPVLTGADIEKMEKPALAKAALAGGVFARVSPAHKLKLMEALKEQGHIVAMTGDGVNDAPALKGADIGIAMGRAGTEVAKEAADMVLTDDNFATIVHAVEEGRVIYSNLRRVVYFLLTTNLGEILTLVGALVFGLDLPLTAVMILWINLVTDGACTVPLGVEPRHSDVLKHPPRAPKAFIVDRRVALRMALLMPLMAAGTLGLFWFAGRNGEPAYARTIAFTAMAGFQWFQAFNARSNYQSVFSIGLFSNRSLLVGVGAAILLQLGAVHTAIGQRLLGTTGRGVRGMKVLVMDNVQGDAEAHRLLREALRRHFPPAHLDYVIHEARAGDPIADIVRRRLCDGVGLVVAAGGDGTVSAVCDGLRGSAIPFGIIPTGTGNLVARELGIPLDLDAAVALLAGPHQTRGMDAMRIGEKAYVLNISVGISAAIVEGTSRRSKRWLGRLAYFGTALREVLSFRRWHLVVEVDGQSQPYRALDVAIMNCGLLSDQLYPRGPKIRIDDGALGVWILSMKTPADYIRHICGVIAGRYGYPLAKFIPASRIVRIRSDAPLPVQADGDIIGTTPIEVTLVPGALTAWAPLPHAE
ncbi:MAG: HAD-IC family P-type ATPase, partial [Lentisphaerae bacterium]|nr:HAD-IC family P-type ATPase [Lentisphaerota bacterium]